MKRNNKKGFTIVELVIVIAVIAILAAVLIPTFSSIIKKAKVNNDVGTIANLNKGLAIAQATDGTPKTMTEVLSAAADIGYTVEKLTPTAEDYYYCWNQNENKFFLVNDEFNPYDDSISYNANNSYWMIIHDATELTKVQGASTKFCLYFAYNPTTAENTTFDATVGVDTGDYDFDLQYAGTMSNVTIRTNGGDLIINSNAGVINHYGDSTIVKIEEVDNNSYHEFGQVGEIKLNKGHVVVESSGEVGSVMVTATVAQNVTVENKNGNLGGIAASNETVAINLRDQVTGIEESKVVTEVVDNSNFAGGLGTEKAPYLIASAEQFKNIGILSTNTNVYFSVTSNISFEKTDLTKVKWDGYDWYTYCCISTTFSGVLNGNGYTLTLPAYTGSTISTENAFVFYSLNGAKIQNLIVSDAHLSENAHNTSFVGISITGSMIFANNEGAIASFVTGTDYFTDCTVSANITSSSYSAVFVGAFNSKSAGVYYFKNCFNTGTYVGVKSSLFVGNAYGQGTLTIYVENCGNTLGGSVRTTDSTFTGNNSYIATGVNTTKHFLYVDGQQTDFTTTLGSGFYQGTTDSLALTLNADGTLCITKSSNSNVAYYEVYVAVYAKSTSEGGTQLVSVKETINKFDTDTLNTSVKYLNFTGNKSLTKVGTLCNWTLVTDGSNTYYLLNKDGYTLGNNVAPSIVNVLAYDADGNLIASATLTK